MAWGMFCWIPCPYKKWREEDRDAMVAMLPLVGACMGAILCMIWWALTLLGAGAVISGILLTGAYFLMTGFIHLDGFMDCSDAVLPKHTEIKTRVRILKDSHSGAFAVVCLCLMLVMFAGAMIEIAPHFDIKACCLLTVIFTFSRLMSAMDILICEAMPSSQYAKAAERVPEERSGGATTSDARKEAHAAGKIKKTIPTIVIAAVILAVAELIISGGSYLSLIAEMYSNIVAVVVIVAAEITGSADRHLLGGMNGDISGHMITMSEMFGVLAMALLV